MDNALKKCVYCNRPLKSPESIKMGYGPVCGKNKDKKKVKPQLDLFSKKPVIEQLKADLRKKGIKVL